MLARTSRIIEELRELVRIVSAIGPEKLMSVTEPGLEKSSRQYARLYRLLRDNPEATEGSIHEKLQKNSDDSSQHPSKTPVSLTKLKSRLKFLLVNTLFTLDLTKGQYSNYSVVLFTVNRLVFIARVLDVFGARVLAASIAKQGLPKAMTIEEWSCAMEFLFVLRSEASQSGDAKAHEVYVREYQQCQKLVAAQQEAEVYMERVQLAFVSSGGEKPEHGDLVEMAAKRIDALASDSPSFKLRFLALRLHSIAAQIRMDYGKTLSLSEQAFALLDRYSQFSNRACHAEYAIMKLVSAIQLREAEVAARAIAQCELYLLDQEDNWFTFKEWQYLFLMHQLDFKAAELLVQTIIIHSRFSTLTAAARAKWELFRLYVEYVNGLRVPVKTPSDFSTIVPSLAADKLGFNTAMILLHVLLLAERKQFAELRDRTEFIKGYRKRFLRGEANSQASHFFSMLGMIETCDLNYKKIVRRASKMLVELRRMEAEDPIQGEQVLPYTWIWYRLMDCLQDYHPTAHQD